MKAWRLAMAVAGIALIAACSNPETGWNKAAAEDTETAYQAFLDRHPEGEWAQKAQAQLDAIRDERDWERAQISDAIQSYNNYLLAHPTGVHMGEARQRISELETEAAWTAAWNAGTRDALEEFLIRYADSPQAEQARARLAELDPPRTPAAATGRGQPAAAKPAAAKPAAGKVTTPATLPRGNYQVQLGAFSSADKAQTARARIEQKHRAIVGPLSVQNPVGNDGIYRVKSAGMTEAAARSACQSLKRAGQDCMVVSR